MKSSNQKPHTFKRDDTRNKKRSFIRNGIQPTTYLGDCILSELNDVACCTSLDEFLQVVDKVDRYVLF